MLKKPPKKSRLAPKKEEKQGLLVRYPGPVLALVTIISVVFSLGAAWAATNARITRLEEVSSYLASKEELNTIKALIQGLDSKLDALTKLIRQRS